VTPLLECQGVAFAYAARGAGEHAFAIRDLSFDVRSGETFGVIGPNASGKTTLVRLLSRVLTPSGGRMLLDGEDLGRLGRPAVARQIAVVPQDVPHGFPHTVEQLVLMGRFPRAPRRFFESVEDRAAARRAMEAVGVLDLRGALLDRLSGGERQRVMLARALAQEPRLLILDEPTAHLDPASRHALTADLLQATQDRSVLFITHQPDGLDQVDHIVVLDHGRIAEQGTHQQLRDAGGLYQRMWESEQQPVR
jgi:ABC-type cobalamin/Fe3+-siderophores transport system ATPase subunit